MDGESKRAAKWAIGLVATAAAAVPFVPESKHEYTGEQSSATVPDAVRHFFTSTGDFR